MTLALMRHRKNYLVTLLATIMLLLPVFAPVASAKSGDQIERITLSPTTVQPAVGPGQTYNGEMTIINDGQTGYDFLVYARPFSVSDENYDPNFTKVTNATESYQWYQLPQTKYHLDPGVRVKVHYSLTVPKGAAPGGYYSVLFAETQPTQPGIISRKKRVGMLSYLTVQGGTVKKSGSVASWKANFYQKRGIDADLRVKNDGNVHFEAEAHAIIKDVFGNAKFTYNKQLIILPSTTRHIDVNWKNAPPFGLYKVGGSVDYLGHTDQLGSHWVLVVNPWILVTLGAIVVLIIIYLILKRLVFSRSKRSRRRV